MIEKVIIHFGQNWYPKTKTDITDHHFLPYFQYILKAHSPIFGLFFGYMPQKSASPTGCLARCDRKGLFSLWPIPKPILKGFFPFWLNRNSCRKLIPKLFRSYPNVGTLCIYLINTRYIGPLDAKMHLFTEAAFKNIAYMHGIWIFFEYCAFHTLY